MILALCLGVFGCTRNNSHPMGGSNVAARLNLQLKSPNEKYFLYLERIENSSLISIIILDSELGVYDSGLYFSDAMKYVACWDDSNNVWLYSGDIGVMFWQKINNKWKYKTFTNDDKINPPELIQNLLK
jgi:hypothetical protein